MTQSRLVAAALAANIGVLCFLGAQVVALAQAEQFVALEFADRRVSMLTPFQTSAECQRFVTQQRAVDAGRHYGCERSSQIEVIVRRIFGAKAVEGTKQP